MFVTPSERRFTLSKRPTPCGSNGAVSPMSTRHPDTDGPTIHAVKHDGRWVLAEEGGDSGAWVAAKAAVRIKDAR